MHRFSCHLCYFQAKVVLRRTEGISPVSEFISQYSCLEHKTAFQRLFAASEVHDTQEGDVKG